jgi:hypothetical protein
MSLGSQQTADTRFKEVEIANNDSVKRYGAERSFPQGALKYNKDGTLTLKMNIADLTEIRSWVLSFG